MGRRAQQKKERRERILRAARHFFSAKGYEATGLVQIAKEAGLAVGTVYNYYPSKAAMLPELRREAVGHVHAQLEAISESPPEDPREALGAVARLWLRQAMEWDGELGRQLAAARLTQPDKVGEQALALESSIMAVLRALVEHYTKSGSLHGALPTEPVTEAVYAIIAAQHTSLLLGGAMTRERWDACVSRCDQQIEVTLYGWLLMMGRR